MGRAVRPADRLLRKVFQGSRQGALLVVALPVLESPGDCRLDPIQYSCLRAAGQMAFGLAAELLEDRQLRCRRRSCWLELAHYCGLSVCLPDALV